MSWRGVVAVVWTKNSKMVNYILRARSALGGFARKEAHGVLEYWSNGISFFDGFPTLQYSKTPTLPQCAQVIRALV
jgi:hypothetical protein